MTESGRGNVVAAVAVALVLGVLAFILYGTADSVALTSLQVEVESARNLPCDACNCSEDFAKWVAKGRGRNDSLAKGARVQEDKAAASGELDVKKPAEKAPYISRCTIKSAEQGGWFRHCTPPPEKGGPERLDGYVAHRMAQYEGGCDDDAYQFHCLEYAARMGWCDWSKQASPQPPTNFLNPDTCDAILKRPAVRPESAADDYADDHKIVFFYPSYAHASTLKRSITSLLHPNHVFLIQADAAPHSNESFVQDILKWANTLDSVCVTQYGRVLYTTASQALITLPALAWADQIEGWTHFYLMGAQTYPIVPLEELREFSWEERDKISFTWNPLRVNEARKLTECLPDCYGYSWMHHNWGEDLHRMGPWIDDLGVEHSADPHSEPHLRVDWLEKRLGRKWNMMKIGGVEVVVLPNDVSKFLLHDARGRMWVQWFTYTTIACEHMMPSILNYYFQDRISQTSSCYMTWEGDSIENKQLNLSDWKGMVGQGLFARKFKLPASTDILDRIDRVLRKTDTSLPRPWHQWSDIKLRTKALETPEGSGPAKIAFLFLTQDSKVSFVQLWNRFFKGHEGKYNIYVHSLPGSRLRGEIGVFAGRQVPSKGWMVSRPTLTAAIRRLLMNALVDDPDNQRFILIPDGTIPVRSFDYLEKLTLLDNPDKSYQNWYVNHWAKRRYNYALRHLVKKEQFAIGSKYFALTRRHARIVVNDTEYWNAFFLCGSDPSDEEGIYCYHDEHYFATLLSIKDPEHLIAYSLVNEDGIFRKKSKDISKAFQNIRGRGDHIVFSSSASSKYEQEFMELGADVLQY